MEIPSLIEWSVKCVVEHFELVNSLSFFPIQLIQRILRIVVEKRKLTEKNLHLFLQLDLNELFLNNCSHLSDKSFKEIAESCPHIKHLSVEECCKLSSSTFSLITKKCNQLEFLDLKGCNLINDSALEAIGENLASSLRTLILHGCYEISNEGLSHISKCKRLEVLDLSYCQFITNSGIETISKGCFFLQRISLAHIPGITDDALFNLGQRCRMIKEINLKGCKQLTDVSIRQLSLCCPLIEKVNLSETNLTTLSPQFLAQNCGQLRWLDLTEVAATDAAVISIGTFSTRLHTLKLRRCNQITDNGLQSILNICRMIEELDLCGCSLISNKTLDSICAGLEHLRMLDLSFCGPLVTFSAITTLVQACQSLTQLHLWGHSLSQANVDTLQQFNPKLKIFCTINSHQNKENLNK